MDIFIVAFLVAELLSAIFGSWYLSRIKRDKPTVYFVCFLWLTVVVEVLGFAMPLLVRSGHIDGLLGGFFKKNHGLYNCYIIINFFFYTWFFKHYLKSVVYKRILSFILGVYVSSTIVNLIFSGIYFQSVSSLSFIFGTLMLLVAVCFYFFEMLQSDEVLDFKYLLQFYVGAGVMLFYICVTPLFIYSNHFNVDRNPEFVYVYRIILRSAVICLYLFYVLGFILCSKNKKSY